MDANQRKHFGFLVLIALALFALYALPNAAASRNPAMVQVFSADESFPLSTVLHMVAPSGSLEQTAKNFIFYGYYPYGLVHFAWSAAVVYPLQWLGLSGNTTWVMLMLRQMVSVLPMLAALLMLVYMQDGFRSYRSYILFVFLAAIPAVVQNNLWWHPDGLVTLFAVLALFFLVRDRLRFGPSFYIAAIACGLAIGTKLVGVFFLLAVAVYLLLGIFQKKTSWSRLLGAGGLFFLVTAATYLLTNPYLFFSSARAEFLKAMIGQGASLSTGYGVIYAKGIIASWPIVHEFFGEAVFILAAIACIVWGILQGSRRLLYLLILAWFIPLTLTVFYFTHFKFQYWLPAILPVLSCVIVLFPEKPMETLKRPAARWFALTGVLLLIVQFGMFSRADLSSYSSSLFRERSNSAISFYTAVAEALAPIGDNPAYIYYDPNMYMPSTRKWTTATTFELLSYPYIQEQKFEVVLLQQSRISDYLNPNAVGIDQARFAENQTFYRQADADELTGFHLIHSDDYGKIFVREDIYRRYFEPTKTD